MAVKSFLLVTSCNWCTKRQEIGVVRKKDRCERDNTWTDDNSLSEFQRKIHLIYSNKRSNIKYVDFVQMDTKLLTKVANSSGKSLEVPETG